jgi:hypothetical protein
MGDDEVIDRHRERQQRAREDAGVTSPRATLSAMSSDSSEAPTTTSGAAMFVKERRGRRRGRRDRRSRWSRTTSSTAVVSPKE